MLRILDNAKALLTDSGGLQKEALFLQTPCITLRDETEWTETLENHTNQLTGPHPEKILQALQKLPSSEAFEGHNPFGDGNSATQISAILNAA